MVHYVVQGVKQCFTTRLSGVTDIPDIRIFVSLIDKEYGHSERLRA